MTERSATDRERIDALLLRTSDGDRGAFVELYDETAALVYGIARRIVRDKQRAEEVSQEAFLEIWTKAVRFDAARGSAKAWICTIAHRRAVDFVRNEQARRDRERRDAAGAALVDHEAPDQVVESELEREQLRGALAGLTELQREALHLAYYEGRTYREVASIVGAPLGTVKTRMRDGLARLARSLETGHG